MSGRRTDVAMSFIGSSYWRSTAQTDECVRPTAAAVTMTTYGSGQHMSINMSAYGVLRATRRPRCHMLPSHSYRSR